jgi:ketosteroid isomerase-like protein
MPDPERDRQRQETIRRFFDAIRTGDRAVLEKVLTPGAITRWPQSGERMTDAMSCVRVYENYPGGPPSSATSPRPQPASPAVGEL